MDRSPTTTWIARLVRVLFVALLAVSTPGNVAFAFSQVGCGDAGCPCDEETHSDGVDGVASDVTEDAADPCCPDEADAADEEDTGSADAAPAERAGDACDSPCEPECQECQCSLAFGQAVLDTSWGSMRGQPVLELRDPVATPAQPALGVERRLDRPPSA